MEKKKRVFKEKYKSNRRIESVDVLLSEYIKSVDWSSELKDASAVLIYNDDYPDREEASRAKYVSGNTLFIMVESPACANEISLRQSQIISYINSKLARKSISKLRFYIGKLK